MNCLNNIERITYTHDSVRRITDLYQFKGKDFYYEDILKNYMDSTIKATIERDTIFASKLLNLNITENRVRLIVKKDSQPKTNDEKILANLKEVFKIIQSKGTDFQLTSNEFLMLGFKIFNGVKELGYKKTVRVEKYNILDDRKSVSKRDDVTAMIKLYENAIYNKKIEVVEASIDLYIDLLNSDVFTENNDFICLVILYCLLFKQRFNVFKYVSFFELYYINNVTFNANTMAASYNWETGFCKTSVLTSSIIDLLLEGYSMVERKVDNFLYDKRIKKIDNVEGIIMKLGNPFTREQIKQKCDLSDSTINRALERLKKEKKIAPNGTGRNATWIKIQPDELFSNANKQMSIYDYMQNIDGK